jgi:hypothetical protein
MEKEATTANDRNTTEVAMSKTETKALSREATQTLVAIAKAGDTYNIPYPEQAALLAISGFVCFHPNTGWYLTSTGRIACDGLVKYRDFGRHTPSVEQLVDEYELRQTEDARLGEKYRKSAPVLAASYRTRASVMADVIRDLRSTINSD